MAVRSRAAVSSGQQRMFERNQHAEIAARRIDAADEGDQQDKGERLGRRKYQAGENHQAGAGEKQAAQFEPRCDEAGEQGEGGGPQQRGAGDDADRLRAEAHGLEVDRENDDGKTVAEAAQRAGGVQAENIRWCPDRAARHVSSPLTERDNAWLRAADRAVADGPGSRQVITQSQGVQGEAIARILALLQHPADLITVHFDL